MYPLSLYSRSTHSPVKMFITRCTEFWMPLKKLHFFIWIKSGNQQSLSLMALVALANINHRHWSCYRYICDCPSIKFDSISGVGKHQPQTIELLQVIYILRHINLIFASSHRPANKLCNIRSARVRNTLVDYEVFCLVVLKNQTATLCRDICPL